MVSMQLASQGKLNDLTTKFNGKTPVRIHFLDNSSKVFLAEDDTTIKDILNQILTKLGIQDITNNLPYFGIFESKNGASIDGNFGLEMLVFDIIDIWSENGLAETAKFLFMIRLYMPCLWGIQLRDVVAFRLNKPKSIISLQTYLSEAEVVDINLIHVQFIQSVYQVITGRYITTKEQALELGAVQFLLKFGEYQAHIHKVGFLGNRIVEFIPIKHLRSVGTSINDWENNLLAKVQSLADSAHVDNDGDANINSSNKLVYFRLNGRPITAQHKYMELIYGMSNSYGFTFYKCTQRCSKNLPDQLYIGIHQHGCGIFDKHKKFIANLHIEDIFRWGFKPNQMFYVEISEENEFVSTGLIEFETQEGKIITDLLTDYAMAFLKEREKEDERYEQMKSGAFNVILPSVNKIDFVDENQINPQQNINSRSAVKPPTTSSKNNKLATEESAAIKIQALGRGYTLRNDWAKEDAAILIQAVYRGYRARILIGIMIEEMLTKGEF